MDNRYFPVFVPTAGRKVLVAGAGNIAARRVKILMEFDFQVTVTAPSACAEIKNLAEAGKLTLKLKPYEPADLEDCYLVLACTDNRDINRQIGQDAKERGILVSVCDCREECTFYFPAIAAGEEVTAGICGSGKDHSATRKAAAAVREIIKGKAY